MVKCKICKRQFKDIDYLVSHIGQEHSESIPSDYSPTRYEYYLRTGRTKGACVVCKSDTEWNEHTNKYHRFCINPACKQEYREIFEKRMIGKHGKVHLLNDPDQQRKMLANRSISGEYKWSDDSSVIPYVASYELDFLGMLDLFMNLPGNDIMGPSPHTYYYEYNKEKKFYIPDFYIPSLNLEIEIKDGGDNENKHPKIQAIDKVKEQNKDKMMASLKGSINYIKIVNKDYKEFFELFLRLRELSTVTKDKTSTRPSVITEGALINHGDNLYVPKAVKFTTPVLNYGKTSKEILQQVKQCKLDQLQPIESDVDSIIAHLNTVIKSKPTDEIHRMKDEAEKEKEFLINRVKPAINRKKEQQKLLEVTEFENVDLPIVMESKLDPYNHIYRPVYILLTYTGTNFSKVIKSVTHQPYSHSSISFDSSLDHLYSFGRKEAGDKMRFIEENIKTGLLGQLAEGTKYSLYVFMATEKQYMAMQQVLNKMKAHTDRFTYNTLGLITNLLGIETEREYSYFCSEFIADIIKKSDASLVNKHPSLFTPSDLRSLPKTLFIKKGTLSKYNKKEVDELVREKMLERGLSYVE